MDEKDPILLIENGTQYTNQGTRYNIYSHSMNFEISRHMRTSKGSSMPNIACKEMLRLMMKKFFIYSAQMPVKLLR
jgi:hypothetical protein